MMSVHTNTFCSTPHAKNQFNEEVDASIIKFQCTGHLILFENYIVLSLHVCNNQMLSYTALSIHVCNNHVYWRNQL